MRIVHTSLRYPPALGGAENYIRDLVEYSRDLPTHPDVRVLTSKLRTHGPITTLPPESLMNDPLYVQRLHHLPTPFISYPQLQALPYYLQHHQPDIIHSYGYWYQPADISARYARQHNIPFIFHPIYYTNAIRQKPVWRLYNHTIGRRTFAAADITVVISPFEQSIIESAGYPVKQFFLLPPPIDVKRFVDPLPNPYLKLGLTSPIILSIGRLAQAKGFQDIARIMPTILKEIPAHLVIIGDDFGYQAQLNHLIDSFGLRAHVHLINSVSDLDLPSYYQHADMYVHASHYEAFGITVAEASAAALPVVAPKATAIPFVAPHEKSGLLFSSPAELTDHTLTLLHDRSLRKRYGISGQKHINQNFSPEITKKKMAALYGQLASS